MPPSHVGTFLHGHPPGTARPLPGDDAAQARRCAGAAVRIVWEKAATDFNPVQVPTRTGAQRPRLDSHEGKTQAPGDQQAHSLLDAPGLRRRSKANWSGGSSGLCCITGCVAAKSHRRCATFRIGVALRVCEYMAMATGAVSPPCFPMQSRVAAFHGTLTHPRLYSPLYNTNFLPFSVNDT
jgi:hypothetical protein